MPKQTIIVATGSLRVKLKDFANHYLTGIGIIAEKTNRQQKKKKKKKKKEKKTGCTLYFRELYRKKTLLFL